MKDSLGELVEASWGSEREGVTDSGRAGLGGGVSSTSGGGTGGGGQLPGAALVLRTLFLGDRGVLPNLSNTRLFTNSVCSSLSLFSSSTFVVRGSGVAGDIESLLRFIDVDNSKLFVFDGKLTLKDGCLYSVSESRDVS